MAERSQGEEGLIPMVIDYISGHIGAGGGEGVRREGLQYENRALSVTFHYHSTG